MTILYKSNNIDYASRLSLRKTRNSLGIDIKGIRVGVTSEARA